MVTCLWIRNLLRKLSKYMQITSRSSYGLLGNFDPLTAMEILKDLDRHHNNINETSTGLFLAKLLLYIIIHSTIITKGRV